LKLPKIDIRYPLVISAGLLAVYGGLLMVAGWRSPANSRLAAQPQFTDYSEAALQRKLASFDPAMAALARRFDPMGAGRATAARLGQSVEATPDQFASDDLAPVTPTEAFRINASVPVSNTPNPPARPFVLDVKSEAGARALDCLTSAVYYEAAYESPSGQAAVAQVVLNRTRHPAFPKSICGVVLQGADRRTGCQFTFTCDGALSRSPNPEIWARSRVVAAAALNGRVEKTVGNATHYHTVWVRPYWSSSLTKVRVIGAHIFYRWNGGWGLGRSFRGQYSGEAGEYLGLRALYAALQPLKLRSAMPSDGATNAAAVASSDSPVLIDASTVTSAETNAVKPVETPPLPPPPPQKFIHVTGEVEKPGDYPWHEGMTVQEAAMAAGGFTYRAKTKDVIVRHAGDAAEAKFKSQGITLQPDDQVRIPQRYF
jgi:spore germination cell wall hydrolase CwlJ-like protein